ncbi:MAG TPA: ice-binding family protein, partial [bacterium]
IGGQTLSPGLYTEAGTLLISSSDLTLDAKGNPNAIFIFQVSQILNVTSGRRVNLIGGAQAKNVFWQVADYCSLGTTVSFVGNILAYNSVTLNTNAVLSGRALGSNGNVTLLANTITKP